MSCYRNFRETEPCHWNKVVLESHYGQKLVNYKRTHEPGQRINGRRDDGRAGKRLKKKGNLFPS